jgi:tetraacyldisaccharide 4'-kinase
MSLATREPALQRILTRTWTRRGALAWLLSPIALFLGAVAAVRRSLYRWGVLQVAHLPVPVVVVGNVVVGGSGKTPVVMAVVRHWQAQGLKVGVVSRGYGRTAKDCREVFEQSPVAEVGDEPALTKRNTSAPVFVAARRVDAARALLAHYPDTQVIVCDDGLQHLALARDLEICVFDDRGVGNGWLLPAGPLREPWPRPVDLVLHTGAHPAFAGLTALRSLAPYAVRADASRVALSDLARPGAPPLLALAAIAKPEAFFSMLRAQGLPLVHTIALPDHYDFSGYNANEYAGYTVICTEKDAVKLWSVLPDALAVPLIFTPEPEFLAQLDARLAFLLATRPPPPLSLPHGHTTS